MPKCGYCKRTTGSVWQTPELIDICFPCMRRQRDELKAQVAAESGIQPELRASYERLTREFEERRALDAERIGILEAACKSIHADLTRLMAALEELE